MNKIYLIALFFSYSVIGTGQQRWESSEYKYSVTVPADFVQETKKAGSNTDFKATNEKTFSTIVVLIKEIPEELSGFTLWESLGDLDSYSSDLQYGMREWLVDPDIIKHGKTSIDGVDAFWFDYTHLIEGNKFYAKSYQVKIESSLFTITLTCPASRKDAMDSTWYRFKENMDFQ